MPAPIIALFLASIVSPTAASGTGSAATPSVNVQVNAGVALSTGTANVAAVDLTPKAFAGAGSAMGTALSATTTISTRLGALTGTGTAYDATTSPLNGHTVFGVTTIGTPTIVGVTLPTPATIAATATVGTPSTLGTLVSIALISGVATVGSPTIRQKPNPATIAATVTIVTPTIHANATGFPAPATPRWSLYDPDTGQLYEFDINPSEEDYQPFSKNILYKNTLPQKTIIYEVQKDATSISWSGTVLMEGQLGALQNWFDNGSVVHLTDDLGREFDIYITEFTPKRVRSALLPWFHTYDMKALVV